MKKAQQEWGMTIGDTDPLPVKSTNEFIAKAMRKAFTIESVESPYIFTHILMRANGKVYAIYEEVYAAGQFMTTSPTGLLAELKKV